MLGTFGNIEEILLFEELMSEVLIFEFIIIFLNLPTYLK